MKFTFYKKHKLSLILIFLLSIYVLYVLHNINKNYDRFQPDITIPGTHLPGGARDFMWFDPPPTPTEPPPPTADPQV